MSSIDTRIAALSAVLQRRQMEQEAPEDYLSKSLREWGQELAALDDDSKSALLQSLNESWLSLNVDAFEQFIADYGE